MSRLSRWNVTAARCIGIGNLYRHDDGVGLYVAQRMRMENIAGVTVIEHEGEGTSLLEMISGASMVILIDATCSGLPPGTISEFSPSVQPLRASSFGHSSHDFGVAEALELARSLNQLPEWCIVYGIEAANFDLGMGLTPAVEKAARRLVPLIARTLWENHAAELEAQF